MAFASAACRGDQRFHAGFEATTVDEHVSVALQARHADIRTDADDAPFPSAAGVNSPHAVDGVHGYLRGLRLHQGVAFSGFHSSRHGVSIELVAKGTCGVRRGFQEVVTIGGVINGAGGAHDE